MAEKLIEKERAERGQGIVLQLLEHVAEDDAVTQAQFAKRVGIAKGLANAYFNRCLQKGWIKLRQVPRQRYLYYLTPKGFAEKARLTASFLSYSYKFYRDARADLVATMADAANDGHARIGVLGDGELAEIAAVVSEEAAVEIVGFVSSDGARKRMARCPVATDWLELDGAEAALLATVDDAKVTYDDFRERYAHVPLYVPAQIGALVWDQQT